MLQSISICVELVRAKWHELCMSLVFHNLTMTFMASFIGYLDFKIPIVGFNANLASNSHSDLLNPKSIATLFV